MPRWSHCLAVVATAGLVLAGCTGYGPREAPRYQAAVPAGSVLELERELDVGPGSGRVYLQDGRVFSHAGASRTARFRPRCYFSVDQRGGGPRSIAPDRFRTGKMSRRVHARAEPASAVRVAATSMAGLRLADSERGGPGFLTYELTIPLSSPDQPAVRRLTCQVDYRVGLSREIGVHDAREALGEVARLELEG